MKATKIIWDTNKTLLKIETKTERRFLGIKLKPVIRVFVATKEYPKGYYNWMESPNMHIVPDKLSFQLNEWFKLSLTCPELINL